MNTNKLMKWFGGGWRGDVGQYPKNSTQNPIETIVDAPSPSEATEMALGDALRWTKMENGGVSLERMAEIAVKELGAAASFFAHDILNEVRENKIAQDIPYHDCREESCGVCLDYLGEGKV